VSDWATVAIAVGPAAITGTVAYFAARFQRDTSKAETEAATLRIRIEHSEAERQHRQGAYHDFLILLEQQAAMMSGFAPLDEAKFQEWIGSFYAQYQGLHLFGAQEVRNALRPLIDAINMAGKEADEGDRSLPFFERMRTAWGRHGEEIVAATDGLTEAMRADVAPELTLPKLGGALEAQRQQPGTAS
jgi:hypothetical protein